MNVKQENTEIVELDGYFFMAIIAYVLLCIGFISGISTINDQYDAVQIAKVQLAQYDEIPEELDIGFFRWIFLIFSSLTNSITLAGLLFLVLSRIKRK